jgi:ABC-type cobalamin/Fe3+-siderophores transport system ATPase subunit
MGDEGLFVERVSFAYPSGARRLRASRFGEPRLRPPGYGAAGRWVLDDVTVKIVRGGLVGILGPNGSGKTTLLRLIAGLLSPLDGHVLVDGVDLQTLRRRDVSRRMAMVPQETQLAFEYTVLEMAVMGRYPHLRAFEVEGPDDIEIAREALRATGTLHLQSRLFNTLSGGEKQRVVIASALAQLERRGREGLSGDAVENPSRPLFSEILLLDEPTASLDLAYQLEIRSILEKLNHTRGLTIVVSTHDLNLAASLCRDLILLDRGRVLAAGPAASMLDAGLIRQLYGVEVDVAMNARTGQLTVIPISRVDARPS